MIDEYEVKQGETKDEYINRLVAKANQSFNRALIYGGLAGLCAAIVFALISK